MPPEEFAVGPAPVLRGESAGEGPAIVLCHGVTATRRYVVQGSRALERAGYRVHAYDARGHGESDPAPPGQGYGYPELVGDLERVLADRVGEHPYILVGHSMGAHTVLAEALRRPRGLAGIVVVGPAYAGPPSEASIAYWDGLAAALEEGGIDGFVAYIEANQGIDADWSETVLRFTRERIGLHRDREALAEALRQVPRSRPFERIEDLAAIEVPALIVASHDEADPGHPYDGRRLRGRDPRGEADQRGAGRLAAGLAGGQALTRDRHLLRVPGSGLGAAILRRTLGSATIFPLLL